MRREALLGGDWLHVERWDEGELSQRERVSGNPELVTALKVHPKLSRTPERSLESKGEIAGDRSPLAENRLQRVARHAQSVSDLIGRKAQGLNELLPEDFARVDRRELVTFLHTPSLPVMVDDFHLFRGAVSPPEADPELVIDTDGELTGAIALQGFQSVPGGEPEIDELGSVVEHRKLSLRDADEVCRKASWDRSVTQKLARALVPEASDRQARPPMPTRNLPGPIPRAILALSRG